MDRHTPIGASTISKYNADIAYGQYYYPFGMTMSKFNGDTTYLGRFGFNGKERDDKDGVVEYDYGFRIYDPRVGRFKSVDPLTRGFAMITPYQFAGNTPMAAVDIDGMELQLINSSAYRQKYLGTYTFVDHSDSKKVKTQSSYAVDVIHSNLPDNYNFGGNLIGKYVGAYGKDMPYPGGAFTQAGEIVGMQDDNKEPTYTTSVWNSKHKFVYTGEKYNYNADKFNTKMGALSMGIDIANFLAKLDEKLANAAEFKDRSAFYKATVIIDNAIKDGRFANIEETFRTGQGRADLINYLNDGTLPQVVSDGSKEQIEISKTYSNKVKSYGDQIMKQLGIPIQDQPKTEESKAPQTSSN